MVLLTTAVTAATAAAARHLVRSARSLTGARALVVELGGAAAGWDDEGVEVVPAESLLGAETVHRAVVLLGERNALHWLRPLTIARALEADTETLWFDPTSLLLADVSDVLETARRADADLAVLLRAPHRIPDDDLEPVPADLPYLGLVATSVLGARRGALTTMRSWAERARGDADLVPWQDQVVSRTPHVLIADDGLAVSPWSIGEDLVEHDPDGRLLLRGAPLRHLDLHGFDPERPWLLDAETARPRVLVSRQPALAALLAEHAARLAGDEDAAHVPTPYARCAAGLPFSVTMARIYRTAVLTGEDAPDPFDDEHPQAFIDWLLEPVPGSTPQITRYLMSVYEYRPDLQASMPGVPERNGRALLAWALRHGRHEAGYDPELLIRSISLAGDDPPAPPHRPHQRVPSGVNVVGFLRGELGIGESARLMLSALAAAQVPHAAVPVSRHLASRQRAALAPSDAPETPYDTTLICVNADHTPGVAEQVPDLVHGRYRIGMWYWEVEEFPESLHHAFGSVDEVWVATDFVRDAIARHSPVPVTVVPPPLPTPHPTTTLTRADLGLPEGFCFLFSFDYLSTAERKNPLGLVEAFRRAFPRGSGPTLVIKSINADVRVAEAERLRTAVANEPDVLLLETYLDAAERDALTLLADCYVSLHRAEGLGLTMAEAMALGKPVIATAYGGNVDFMTEENSYLVPWERVPIPEGCAPYPVGTPWADPDLDAAAAAMRAVVEDPDEAARRGARAAQDIATLHSPAAAGRVIAERLEEIRQARVRRSVSRGLRVARRLTGAWRRGA